MNLDSAVIDIYDDVYLESTLEKCASKIPSNLREVEIPSIEDRNDLDDTQFALSIFTKHAKKLNKFPIDSEINTALSNTYFDINHHKLPFEAQKVAATYIRKACQQYGIEPSESVKTASEETPLFPNIYIEKLNDKSGGPLIKESGVKEDPNSNHFYALTKTAGDRVVNRMYAMPSVVEVKKAETYFDKYAKQFNPEERHEFALNVVGRASELGTTIESKNLLKYAGALYSAELENHIETRKNIMDGNSQVQDALDKLASMQEKTDPKTFAKALHKLDKIAGLDKYYDRYLPDPFASTFSSGTTKTAEALFEIDGLEINEGDVEKVANNNYATLKSYFGETLADGLKKEGTAAFVALPETTKEVIARILHGEIS